MIFNLLGTPEQNGIIQRALDRTNFPFDLLRSKLTAETGRTSIPVNWADLTRYAAQLASQKAAGKHAHIHEVGDTGHPIEARERLLGLAWYSGRVTIEQSLINEPELAQEVFLSEGAHMVDFFWMTEEMRQAIFNAMHGSVDNVVDHGHDWFDVGPYSSWVGEAFMGLFVRAFSDVQMTIRFEHPVTPFAITRAREVLVPAPPTPEPQPEPEEEPPVREGKRVFGSARSKVYHDAHARVSQDIWWDSIEDAVAAGRRPCKTCKPGAL